MELYEAWCHRGQRPIRKCLQIPIISRAPPTPSSDPNTIAILTCTEGSFSYQGVGKGGLGTRLSKCAFVYGPKL